MRPDALLVALLLAHTVSPALCARQLAATDASPAATASVTVSVSVQVNVSAAAAAVAAAEEAGGELQVSRYSAQQCAWLDTCLGAVRAHARVCQNHLSPAGVSFCTNCTRARVASCSRCC
jgi:hypothetical protein